MSMLYIMGCQLSWFSSLTWQINGLLEFSYCLFMMSATFSSSSHVPIVNTNMSINQFSIYFTFWPWAHGYSVESFCCHYVVYIQDFLLSMMFGAILKIILLNCSKPHLHVDFSWVRCSLYSKSFNFSGLITLPVHSFLLVFQINWQNILMIEQNA